MAHTPDDSLKVKASRTVKAILGEDAEDDFDAKSIRRAGNLPPPDEELDDDDVDPNNEIDLNAEEGFQTLLRDILEARGGMRVSTFEEAGIMTRNKGLVVKTPDSKFQLTIVEDRRGY